MLNILPSLLAAADTVGPLGSAPVPEPAGTGFNLAAYRDMLLIIGAAAAVSIILFLWAYLTRQSRRRQFANAHGIRMVERAEKGSSPHEPGHRKRIRKRRREHPDNLGRNPTLAEAGGLPPPRLEDPEPPSPPATASPDAAPVPPPSQPT